MSTPISGLNATTVFVGLICLQSEWDTGFSVAVAEVSALITANELDARIVTYLIDDNSQFEEALQTFIARSDRFQKRALIAGTTTQNLLRADAVCRFRFIPVFSVGASATSILTDTSEYACTWMPLNRNVAMFFFMLHCLYARTNAFVVYDESDEEFLILFRSFLQDMRDQAAQFHQVLCFRTLESITTSLPEDATILLLASNAAIQAAGPTKLRCLTPNSSILLMTDVNTGARASWFGSGVVPLCAVPYAIDYTSTTRRLVEAMGDNIFTASTYMYALFDCLYSLAKFSLVRNKELTVPNFINNPVTLETDVAPAFMPLDGMCVANKSPCYCKYSICFVKPAFVTDEAAFRDRFDGGNPIFPDGLATLFQMSYSRTATTFVLETNRFYRLRNGVGDILLEKFDTDQILTFDTDTFVAPVNGHDAMPLGLTLEFDASGVPTKLLNIQYFGGTLPVSDTMGKTTTEFVVSPSDIIS